MPDGPNPYQTNEDEIDGQFEDQQWSQQPSSTGYGVNDMPMPRKAIARKPTIEAAPPDEPEPNLDYGVYADAEEEGYKKYAPAPSKASMRKHMRQSMEKNEKLTSETANPLKTALFQFTSMLPGMQVQTEAPRNKRPEPDKSFRAPSDPVQASKPAAPKQGDFTPASLTRKSALDDLKRDEGGRGSNRDVGSLEQSPIAKLMEKFFPSNDDYSVQEVEDPATKRKKAMIRFGMVAGFFILVFAAYKLQPRQTQYFDQFPLEYRSAEKERSFKVIDSANAVYQIGSDTQKTPITFFMNDWRDFADVVLTSPFQKQIWLEKTDSGVKDLNTNIEMFEQRSPESIASRETQKIADSVIAYWNKTHTYPTKPAEIGGKYFNPFTEKDEPLQIKVVNDGDTKSGEDVEAKKTDLYRQLVFDKAKVEGKQAPGTIACWNIHFIAAHQNLNVFVIKPYGKNGASILSGHTDAQYFVAVEDGSMKELLPAKPLSEWIGKAGIFPQTTVFFTKKLDSTLLFLLRHAAKIVFTVIAFAAAGFLLSLKKGDSPWLWVFVLVASGIPAALALAANFIH